MPLWFRVWDRFTNWMTDAKESPRPDDVMMKEGWWGWSVIQKRAIPSEESYNRIVLSRAGGCE